MIDSLRAIRADASDKDSSLRALVGAQFISILGSQMADVAIPWFVLSTTGSAGLMTIVLVFETLPYALLALPAGALVDRVDAKRLMVALDLLRVAVAATLPVLSLLHVLRFWMIPALAFLLSAFSVPYMSAKMTMIPLIVGEDEQAISRANMHMQMSIQITTILGPVLAGVLIGVIGNAAVLLINAASFLAGAAVLWVGVSYTRRRKASQDGRILREDLLEGLRFTMATPVVRGIVFIGVGVMFGFWMVLGVGTPVFVKDVLHQGSQTFGLLLGVWGVGAALGMLAQQRLVSRRGWNRGLVLAVSLAVLGTGMWVASLPRMLPWAMVGFFLGGMADGPLAVVMQTILQTETPPHIRGRVFSVYQSLTMMVTPLAMLVVAPVVERWGAMPVMYGSAALFSVCAVVAFRSRTLREA